MSGVKSDIEIARAAKMKPIKEILDRLNIPKSLSEIDVPEDCAERIAKKAMQDQAYATNPKEASLLQMKDIVTQSIKQAR